MTAPNTFSIDFIARKVKNNPTLACIFARITINGETAEISLKEKVVHTKWDPRAECMEGKTAEVRDINNYIDIVRNKIRNAYRQLADNNEVITIDAVRDKYFGVYKLKNAEHTLLALIQLHEKECGRRLKPGTMKNYGATEAYVTNYIKSQYNAEDIHVSLLDFAFITKLENYIPLHPIKKHDPCIGNGVAKHIERLTKIVKWGKKMKWLKENPFEDFSAHRTKTRRKKLKVHQLVAIENATLQSEHLQYVRDLFIFSCYTGISFSDVMNLSMNDFEISSNGKFWCTLYRQKSTELSAVPVLPTAVKIIKKYKEHPRSVRNGTIFPPISNQEVNRCLKIIREICKITIDLTFHVARHTFAYVVALKNGVPLKTVQIILGHTKITTTEVYIDVDEEMLEEDMANVESKLEKRKAQPSPTDYLSKS